jgi:hypothetical protein
MIGMAQIDGWLAAYGPTDGEWLRDEFQHITSGVKHVENIRVARLDSETEMARYHEQIDEISGVTKADWEVTSPYTGLEYRMGCDWHD